MHNTFIKVELGFAPPRAYTYAWEGDEPIARDDFVIVPPNSYNPSPAIGRVLRTMEHPDFEGTVTILTQKAETQVRQREVTRRFQYSVYDGGDVL